MKDDKTYCISGRCINTQCDRHRKHHPFGRGYAKEDYSDRCAWFAKVAE